MACFLDGTELVADQVGVAQPATLGAWLDAARAKAAEGGRVVVEVRVDDVLLGHEQLDDRQGLAIEAEQDIRLTSAEPSALSVDALGEARRRLSALAEEQQSAADLLQGDRAGEALAKVGDAVQGWIDVANAVTQSAQLNALDLDTLRVSVGPDDASAEEAASAIIAGLGESLSELKELIASGDTTGLADALGYEWPALIERWDGLLAGMIGALEA